MFNRLGWCKVTPSSKDVQIEYYNEKNNFTIAFSIYRRWYVEDRAYDFTLLINMALMQAIITQCKELGWL